MIVPVRTFTLAPTGIEHPDPPSEHFRRVLTRIFSGRLQDARLLRTRHPTEETSHLPWKLFTDAALVWMEGDYTMASDLARKCAGVSLQSGLTEPTQPDELRLAASAMEMEGSSLRRCEQYPLAERIHRAAFELRREHGRSAEQIESAISLAACRHWAGDTSGALSWLRRATALPAEDQAGARQSAWARLRLSMALTEQACHDEAIQAAREAHEIFGSFFPDQHFAWVANLHMTEAMIRQVEFNLDGQDAAESFAPIALGLTQCQRELEAFGDCSCSDLEWCALQLDFLSRLKATIG